MSAIQKQPFVDSTKIGDQAASQPLSGVKAVDESGSVHGMAHFVRGQKAETGANNDNK